MRTMTRQLTELEEQLDYMKEVARGEVDALIEPCSGPAAGSISLVGGFRHESLGSPKSSLDKLVAEPADRLGTGLSGLRRGPKVMKVLLSEKHNIVTLGLLHLGLG